MAEVLFAAKNIWTGPAGNVLKYSRGDPIAVFPDGQIWGNEEGPNKPPAQGGSYAVVQIPGLDPEKVRPYIEPFYEDSQPGDPNFDAPDAADRRELRWRRKARLAWSEVPQAKIDELRDNGVTSVTISQVRAFFRRLGWNGISIELTAEEVIT